MRTTRNAFIVGIFAAAGAAVLTPSGFGADRLGVHEWGTFTSLQDESGHAIGGINTDDEPVPDFVHNVNPELTPQISQLPQVLFKAIPRCHPDVYTRLETPVVYFYPPAGWTRQVDVQVSYRGGWLTQFYPTAALGGDVNPNGELRFGHLNVDTVGSLLWKRLSFGGREPGPATHDKVWLAPRDVQAASVTTSNGERERYLFYRGVSRNAAPVRIVRQGGELHVRSQWETTTASATNEPSAAWLVDVRADGQLAFRPLEPLELARGEGVDLTVTQATFSESDYSAENLTKVTTAIHAALEHDGLFADEATALLNTWRVSYFGRPGLRLFFMTPRSWTDHYLPMTVSEPADITRVMVGRIEIVTPQQRALVAKIATGPASDSDWATLAARQLGARAVDAYREDWYRELNGPASPLAKAGIKIPEDYQAYLRLGRFRNALINDEAARRPTEPLRQFIRNYSLELQNVK